MSANQMASCFQRQKARIEELEAEVRRINARTCATCRFAEKWGETGITRLMCGNNMSPTFEADVYPDFSCTLHQPQEL
jgi:hypothetical protein